MEQVSAFPVKTREMHNHHFDSTIWNDFQFRDDDIIIATYAKSGTTWMQQIVSQLIFDGIEGLEVAEMSPWLDLRIPPREVKLPPLEAQQHRRFIKTHLPLDALVYSPKVKYIFIGRDGRDVIWSMYNHHYNANQHWYDALNLTPGLVGPPIEKASDSVVEYFREWLDKDGYPFWSFWQYLNSWWPARNLPNVHFVHFQNLKDDLAGEIKKIAAFLDIPLNDEKFDAILEHCSFNYMKKNAVKSVPLGGAFWDGGAETFINKGVNGRWRDMLSAEESARYEAIAAKNLDPECDKWIRTGQM